MPRTATEMVIAANAVVPKITPEEARDAIAGGNVLVVDVRDAPELAASGKVAGALHVSRGLLEFQADPASPAHIPAFDPEQTVILYCGSGGRAALAGKALLDLGYRDVRNLGGLAAWVESGGAVE